MHFLKTLRFFLGFSLFSFYVKDPAQLPGSSLGSAFNNRLSTMSEIFYLHQQKISATFCFFFFVPPLHICCCFFYGVSLFGVWAFTLFSYCSCCCSYCCNCCCCYNCCCCCICLLLLLSGSAFLAFRFFARFLPGPLLLLPSPVAWTCPPAVCRSVWPIVPLSLSLSSSFLGFCFCQR